MRKNELISQRFGPRGVRPITDSVERGTPADTLRYMRRQIAALEWHSGLKPPQPEPAAKPLPPPMGRPAGIPRTTQLVSTEQDRAIAARRAAAATEQSTHNRTTRFFSGPVEPPNARIPRASATGPVV
jgi:hypothetical protein